MPLPVRIPGACSDEERKLHDNINYAGFFPLHFLLLSMFLPTRQHSHPCCHLFQLQAPQSQVSLPLPISTGGHHLHHYDRAHDAVKFIDPQEYHVFLWGHAPAVSHMQERGKLCLLASSPSSYCLFIIPYSSTLTSGCAQLFLWQRKDCSYLVHFGDSSSQPK